MKTYQETTAKPRLVIGYDQDADSPRKGGINVGYFFTAERRHKSPDGNIHPLYTLMVETADSAKDTQDHIRLMKLNASVMFKASAPSRGNSHDEDLHIIEIYPVYRYEHGNVSYKRGTAGGFDYSNCGFYIVTAQSQSGSTWTAESLAKAIDDELEQYTKWCNGEVYQFMLYNERGELQDSMGGFYEIEDIHEYLPEEWEDEELEQYCV